jgi:uncharacterized protein YqfA (UPF0365 family)
MGPESGCFILIVIVVLLAVLMIIGHFIPLPLWLTAQAAGVRVGLMQLFYMRLRKVPPEHIIRPLIMATQAGLNLRVQDLESYYMQGGRVFPVVNALIAATKANITLDFQRACAIDRAGRDVLEAVKMSVNPKVIETPEIAAVAQDGIEVKSSCKVTVRANIERLIGGAGEETVIARVQEGICTAVGSAEHFQLVLESPDRISKTVLAKGLDVGTAFEILSIDIADVDVGRNIGATLQTNQAEADKQIAQARAETRRANALAKEQEMRAKVQEQKAKLVEAQAQVPLAMADSLRTGKMSVLDYYQLKNIIADTQMRQSISGVTDEKQS